MSERFGPGYRYLYGSHDVERLFPEGKPSTITPWGSTTRSKVRQDYEKDKVESALKDRQLSDIDPRNLKSTQPFITRAGVSHYMQPGAPVYRDSHQAGNKDPVVYKRGEEHILLSGHHRAAAALLQGRQFKGILVEGDWGPPRGG